MDPITLPTSLTGWLVWVALTLAGQWLLAKGIKIPLLSPSLPNTPSVPATPAPVILPNNPIIDQLLRRLLDALNRVPAPGPAPQVFEASALPEGEVPAVASPGQVVYIIQPPIVERR
jgi:hypothetical protein